MPCVLKVDRRLKQDILNQPAHIQLQIGTDLLALQTDPLPADRQDLDGPYGYVHQLPCGVYVSWELLGNDTDILHLILTGICHNVTVRILAACTDSPAKPK
jgi:hypothetical protein